MITNDRLMELSTMHRNDCMPMRAELEELVAAYRGANRRAIPPQAVCFFMDGNQWCCVNGDFVDLAVSPAGFGDTFVSAMENLKPNAVLPGNGKQEGNQ